MDFVGLGKTLVLAAFAAAGSSSWAAAPVQPADALRVVLTADQPVVTVDRDAPTDQVLVFEVVVGNDGDELVPGVVVEARLPGGTVVQTIGDVAPGAQARVVLRSTISSTSAGGPVESVAVARSADGVEVASAPVRTDIQVISSAVYDRDDDTEPAEVATEVLGVMETRPLAVSLARTGVPLAALAAAGVALVVSGGALLRQTGDDG